MKIGSSWQPAIRLLVSWSLSLDILCDRVAVRIAMRRSLVRGATAIGGEGRRQNMQRRKGRP